MQSWLASRAAPAAARATDEPPLSAGGASMRAQAAAHGLLPNCEAEKGNARAAHCALQATILPPSSSE